MLLASTATLAADKQDVGGMQEQDDDASTSIELGLVEKGSEFMMKEILRNCERVRYTVSCEIAASPGLGVSRVATEKEQWSGETDAEN